MKRICRYGVDMVSIRLDYNVKILNTNINGPCETCSVLYEPHWKTGNILPYFMELLRQKVLPRQTTN
ncbi:hypothetical protein PBCV1_a259bR [Paramecium bursaria Chlorella virus 1]|uniref:Uncharacterized protein n=1 Tax=Paramecium bursaria Chlorella virus 1 TaxID=10506 RepID=O41017_PBCV1|nr:hypothetical protein PBCV1_a259bR [Paramecium bursaria Chlorella virus 1]AAC97064.2 hypothetical protein [Paramecium bursaria Chlorella virus 1]